MTRTHILGLNNKTEENLLNASSFGDRISHLKKIPLNPIMLYALTALASGAAAFQIGAAPVQMSRVAGIADVRMQAIVCSSLRASCRYADVSERLIRARERAFRP